ncbi:MAG: hypothetical protein IT246_08205 [Bacteroidia bacterium]|nr:hypothetical protein [Bacteroidia bacterium]
MVWSKILSYLMFWKNEPTTDSKSSFSMRAMHRINRISVLIFIFAILYLAVKYAINTME